MIDPQLRRPAATTPTVPARSFPVPAGHATAPFARRRAAGSLAWFAGFAVLLNFGLVAALDYGPPRLRDPEYGLRLEAARDRIAADPGRPVVVVLGSSRVAMGLRPDVLANEGRPFTLLNLALAGSGPIMQRMALHRAIADGVTPDAVLIEYWPAFFREDGVYHEAARFDIARLRPVDVPMVRAYFPDPDATEAAMRTQRRWPWYFHREGLIHQIDPGWLPPARRTDAVWRGIDRFGWQKATHLPQPGDHSRAMAATARYYGPLFAAYQVSPVADQALRDLVADGRGRGVPIALVYLPEPAEFRALMPPAAVAAAEAHLAAVRADLALPLIDARGWVPDAAVPDGFHMTPDAAAVFTERLADAVAATFPGLTR